MLVQASCFVESRMQLLTREYTPSACSFKLAASGKLIGNERARVGYARQSAPFHPCSGASSFSILFLLKDLRSSGRELRRVSGVLLRTCCAALPDADIQRLIREVCPAGSAVG